MLGLTLDEYQRQAGQTAIYPNRGAVGGLSYATLGLTGEAGEIANKVKKLYRDRMAEQTSRMHEFEEARVELVAELGDVLWYAAQLASELGVTLGFVAEQNLKKLKRRAEQNALQGSGDHRGETQDPCRLT